MVLSSMLSWWVVFVGMIIRKKKTEHNNSRVKLKAKLQQHKVFTWWCLVSAWFLYVKWSDGFKVNNDSMVDNEVLETANLLDCVAVDVCWVQSSVGVFDWANDQCFCSAHILKGTVSASKKWSVDRL